MGGNMGVGIGMAGKLMGGTPVGVALVVEGEVVDRAAEELGAGLVVVDMGADTGEGIAEEVDNGGAVAGGVVAGEGIAGEVDTGEGNAGGVDTGEGIAGGVDAGEGIAGEVDMGVVGLEGVDREEDTVGVDHLVVTGPGAARPSFSERGSPPWRGPW